MVFWLIRFCFCVTLGEEEEEKTRPSGSKCSNDLIKININWSSQKFLIQYCPVCRCETSWVDRMCQTIHFYGALEDRQPDWAQECLTKLLEFVFVWDSQIVKVLISHNLRHPTTACQEEGLGSSSFQPPYVLKILWNHFCFWVDEGLQSVWWLKPLPTTACLSWMIPLESTQLQIRPIKPRTKGQTVCA